MDLKTSEHKHLTDYTKTKRLNLAGSLNQLILSVIPRHLLVFRKHTTTGASHGRFVGVMRRLLNITIFKTSRKMQASDFRRHCTTMVLHRNYGKTCDQGLESDSANGLYLVLLQPSSHSRERLDIECARLRV